MWTLSLLFHRVPAPVNVFVAEACWMKGFQRQATHLFQYKWNNYFLTVTCIMLVRQLQLNPVILNLFRIPRLFRNFELKTISPGFGFAPQWYRLILRTRAISPNFCPFPLSVGIAGFNRYVLLCCTNFFGVFSDPWYCTVKFLPDSNTVMAYWYKKVINEIYG